MNDILHNISSLDRFFTHIHFILVKDRWVRSNKGKKKSMETNYKLWIEGQFDELHDKFVESVKRNNNMKNLDNDELDAEIFNNKVYLHKRSKVSNKIQTHH